MSATNKESRTELWKVSNLTRELGESEEAVFKKAAEKLGIPTEIILSSSLLKRSIDARGRRAPRFIYQVQLELAAGTLDPAALPPQVSKGAKPELRTDYRLTPDKARPIVIGAGPCGLFAALQFAEAGLKPILVDRGKPVESRAKDVSKLMGKGIINEDSNLCFGEGGAGTWSDGKLYTRVGGNRIREVLERLVEHGAPDRILVDGRPHMGTDKLVKLLKNLRATLIELGAEVRYDACVSSLTIEDDVVTGVKLRDGETIQGSHVVLALGHSSRDLYRTLAESKIFMKPKPFAVGFRIEHTQALIDELQYGRWSQHADLPAAYYELKTNLGEGAQRRGVFSFCMCPGGSVVPTPTVEGEVCVNGMSHAARSGKYANSALVTQVEPSDYLSFAHSDSDIDQLLAGIAFQQAAEAHAWERGGGAFVAPAQRVPDYLAKRTSSEVRRTTYKRGVAAAELNGVYPDFVDAKLHEALHRFNRRMPGYISEDAVLIGVETRTSAPVTIERDSESLQSLSHKGLYPAGEGAGYGGGIVSAAIDGLRIAQRICDELSN